jgi:hypothetical protein
MDPAFSWSILDNVTEHAEGVMVQALLEPTLLVELPPSTSDSSHQ